MKKKSRRLQAGASSATQTSAAVIKKILKHQEGLEGGMGLLIINRLPRMQGNPG